MPSTQLHRALALAVVLLAGCAAPVGPQPSGAPDAGGDASNESQAALPAGVSASGVENLTALLAAHRRSLRAAGYRATEIRADAQFEYVAAPNYSAYRVIPGPGTPSPAVWANESVALARETRDGEAVYHRPPRLWPRPARLTGAASLRPLFDASTYAPNGTEPCGNRTCTVLTATGSDRLRNFSARALVHSSGVVYQFHATYTAADGNRTEYHFVLEQRGDVAVARPPWVGTALEES